MAGAALCKKPVELVYSISQSSHMSQLRVSSAHPCGVPAQTSSWLPYCLVILNKSWQWPTDRHDLPDALLQMQQPFQSATFFRCE